VKILLDVGANTGQTVHAALDPKYGFDRIVAFEPAPACWPELERIDDPRVQVCRFGLWNRTCQSRLHNAGSEAGSIFEDFDSDGRSGPTETIELVRARDWFSENVSDSDLVFMKLNCEGAECDVVEDLLDGGEFGKVYNAVISFDVRKSDSLRGRELPLRRRLVAEGYSNVSFSEDVMHGPTHEERIRHWLERVGAHEQLPPADLRRKYADTLQDLSQRSGRLVRFEQWLRVHLFRWLPDPAKAFARRIWGRLMRGRRTGPE
jgi:FkbM family methyltransferase